MPNLGFGMYIDKVKMKHLEVIKLYPDSHHRRKTLQEQIYCDFCGRNAHLSLPKGCKKEGALSILKVKISNTYLNSYVSRRLFD